MQLSQLLWLSQTPPPPEPLDAEDELATLLDEELLTLEDEEEEVVAPPAPPVPEEVVDERLDFHALYGVDGRLHAVGGNLAVPSDATGVAWRRELGDDE